MAEISQADLETKISDLDAKIATITSALAGGTAAAQYTDYALGQLRVNGSQQLEQLMKAREMYQGQLQRLPKEVADVHTTDLDVKGEEQGELLGDE